MKILSVKSLFFLGVAVVGLGGILSGFIREGEGRILGDSTDANTVSIPGATTSLPRTDSNQGGVTTTAPVLAPVAPVAGTTPTNQEQHIVQEITIPRTIEDTTHQVTGTSTGGTESAEPSSQRSSTANVSSVGSAVTQRENRNPVGTASTPNRRENRATMPTRQNTVSHPSTPLMISTAGDVKVTTEIAIKPHESIKETGFYSKGFSGQENYLGNGREIARGIFEYQGDLSRQLSNGEQEIIFKSKKETLGSNGEKLISEETKSIPVIVDVPGNVHEVLALKEEKKQELIVGLGGQGVSQQRRAELAAVSAENIPFVKEAENKDFDQDGLTNAEERRLGTDPFLADTDNDGFLDGDEVKNGYDPKKFSPGDGRDKIAFENPRDVIETERRNPDKKTKNDQYVVNAVSSVKASVPGEKDKMRFSGKALPNIFVTLYIYSNPIVVTLKTDANGNWSYDLDKTVEDGSHEVYVAVTDNTGKITARSDGLGFVKTASAITIQPTALASETPIGNQSPFDRSLKEYLFVACIAILFFSGAALMVIGRRRRMDGE
jgi:hypothetical protein